MLPTRYLGGGVWVYARLTGVAHVHQGVAIERRADIISDSSGLSLLEYYGFHDQIALYIVLVWFFPLSSLQSYEGTGRSLSLKLLQQLEDQSHMSKNLDTSISGRIFKKIELSESIRYAFGDPIESWLNELLSLDVANSIAIISRLPPPSECDLYYVNRNTYFSFHTDSELFL
ncbi:hypothetical protein Cgig2_000549 [Carnegiea gigantea]|uniref:TcmA/NAT10 helicase domain-containing protein n=1 Tax=Carnegiea gigantea TaxID=171969 RepID=A0A9Q1GT37_9CARY|nr:hypothetical protein Cgig2_000549 [Carnegiea gigantea]